MKYRRLFVCVTFSLLVVTAQRGFAQSAVMPLPNLVAVDADGKAIGEVVDFVDGRVPVVALNIDDLIALLAVSGKTLSNLGVYNPPPPAVLDPSDIRELYFSGTGCTGDVYVLRFPGWEAQYTKVWFGVLGPDPISGEFDVYRSTQSNAVDVWTYSAWDYGHCYEMAVHHQYDTALPAEKVIPNPLEGFHGPTDAEPDRKLRIVGGARIRQPLAANGTACTVPGECASGFCVDDYCCDTSCDDLCESCSTAFAAGPSGTCSPIFAGIDPDDECGSNCCDGAGACDSSGGC